MRHFFAILLLLTLLAACSPGLDVPQPIPTETALPSPTAGADQPTATTGPAAYWIGPGVPPSLEASAVSTLGQAGWIEAASAEEAAIQIGLNPGPEATSSTEIVYALVAPFPTVPDAIAFGALSALWTNHDGGQLSGFAAPPRMIVTLGDAEMLAAVIGPASPGLALEVFNSGSDDPYAGLVEAAWNARPAISVVPFERLEPRWKVLAIDGQSPVEKSFDAQAYPLTVRVGLTARGDAGNLGADLITQSGAWPVTNRDPAKLTTVVMTGVTALSRAVAKQMEVNGVDFPAREIMFFLADADVLHTSNEASFTPDCPEPDWFGEPVFCEQRETYELLRMIGLDIIEVTGNHNLDYGTEAAINSLNVYDAEGLPYYGGGRTLEDAIQPRILTAPDGTRFAFVGCNSAGPYRAWATEATPGAAPCDDWTRLRQQIGDLKAQDQADVVIVTVQYLEADRYDPTAEQRADFEALSLAGADIVSGSQAHQPQGFSFPQGRMVHFGVGNLFFDQIDLEGNRQMFADKHVFYEGHHLSTVLFTGYFEEIGQPRPMTAEERAAFLQTIFTASGW